MSKLRHILAAAVFATAAVVVADDQADRAAPPARAEAAHSLPGLAAAAHTAPVSAHSGRPARPAAATAAAGDLEMTLELREPRREPLLVRLPVAPGEPFRKLTMDGAESYTVCGELTDRGKGRFEPTVAICHWRTAQVRPTFTTTLPSTPPRAAGDEARRDVRHSPNPAKARPKARPQPWPGPSTHSWAPRTDPGPSSWRLALRARTSRALVVPADATRHGRAAPSSCRPTLRAADKRSLSLWPSLLDGHCRPPGGRRFAGFPHRCERRFAGFPHRWGRRFAELPPPTAAGLPASLKLRRTSPSRHQSRWRLLLAEGSGFRDTHGLNRGPLPHRAMQARRWAPRENDE